MEKVFIGMPVYNGADFINRALDGIRNQSFRDWSLLISDNGSEDETKDICQYYAKLDNRVKYYRQERNLGAVANFKFLLDNANGTYFAWAAADDVWQPDFLLSCVSILEQNDKIGMAFCNIVNVDGFDNIVRNYQEFSLFANNNGLLRVSNYLFSPEILGKANLIYSVFHLDLCRAAWEASPLTDRWGSDMCFVLAALARSRVRINAKVLFHKRVISPIIGPEINPHDYIFPLKFAREYIKDNATATKGTGYYLVTLFIMILRYLRALIRNNLIKLLK